MIWKTPHCIGYGVLISQPECGPSKVLIKKCYDRNRRSKRRNWKLHEMDRDREGMAPNDERWVSELFYLEQQNNVCWIDSMQQQ